jgi:tRNA (guanine9-N1)-methyltransferase
LSSKLYVIGGIVDHNAYKNFTLGYAMSKGIKCQKFPITENIKLKGRTVLTVNQCFEIMLRKWMGFTWRKSLEDTIPGRKWMSIDEWNRL